MRKFLKILAIVVVVIAGLWFVGPSEPFDRTPTFDRTNIGEDLDAYLAAREADIDDITPGAEKEIIWAGEVGARTDIAIVYLHGFSATKQEIRPVPDRVAAALGANLYFTRLKGHGRSGPAMDEARAGDWWNDTAEAIAIGRKLGNRIVLMGTSTGGTLATLALSDAALSTDVAGMVAVSPNYRFFGAPMALMMMPFGRQIIPLIAGAERSWEAHNPEQEKWWTTRYPMTATLPMAATVNQLAQIDYGAMKAPAMFIFNDADEVVDHKVTRDIAAQWGAGATILNLEPGPGEAPSRHVITGDIISPSTTDEATAAITEWIRGL